MAPCGWTLTSCGCGSCWDSYSPDVQTRAAALAAYVMWAATGRQYGKCPITVRPCNPTPVDPLYVEPPLLLVDDSLSLTGFLVGGCGGGCSCASRCEVALSGPTTKADVSSVKINGDTVDPDAYQVHNGYLLVRVDGTCWPTCNNPGQEVAGFEVTYQRGLAIPTAVQSAYEVLACEYAKACADRSGCRLPSRLRSLTRQGVEVEVEPAAVATGIGRDWSTGIDEVDRVISAVNPHRRAERPVVYSPDLPPPRVVT